MDRYLTLFNAGRFVARQRTQPRRSGLMHRSPHGHLDRCKVQLTRLAALLKDNPEQSAYFAFDFLPDRCRRFLWSQRVFQRSQAADVFKVAAPGFVGGRDKRRLPSNSQLFRGTVIPSLWSTNYCFSDRAKQENQAAGCPSEVAGGARILVISTHSHWDISQEAPD
jgi:hypothetical protein